MFSLNGIIEVRGQTLKCDYDRYVPSWATFKEVCSHIFVVMPREVSAPEDSYLELDFDVLNCAKT